MNIKDLFGKSKNKISETVDEATDVVADKSGQLFGEESKAHRVVQDVGEKVDETVDKLLDEKE